MKKKFKLANPKDNWVLLTLITSTTEHSLYFILLGKSSSIALHQKTAILRSTGLLITTGIHLHTELHKHLQVWRQAPANSMAITHPSLSPCYLVFNPGALAGRGQCKTKFLTQHLHLVAVVALQHIYRLLFTKQNIHPKPNYFKHRKKTYEERKFQHLRIKKFA